METYRAHKPITGAAFIPGDFNLYCPYCNDIHKNIRAILVPLPYNKNFPNKRVCAITYLHPDDVCKPLADKICQHPYINLYEENIVNN